MARLAPPGSSLADLHVLPTASRARGTIRLLKPRRRSLPTRSHRRPNRACRGGTWLPRQVAPSSVQTALDAAKLAEAAGGLLGPVQVEFVEGLDVIVLRGSDRDVQRVMEIIKQIEDLSAVTVPEIQITS